MLLYNIYKEKRTGSRKYIEEEEKKMYNQIDIQATRDRQKIKQV